jgi:GNAT superfamily N-acetyltransferase
VCKVVDGVVWAESIYVDPPSRRGGVGSMLFEKANELARGNKHDTAYAWVHPNNDVVISFLKRHGYDVLNLVEVRRAHEDERLDQTVTLMRNSFRY